MKKKIKKIAITGGKGGTGKSTFSILFAKELLKKGKKVVLVDCDVECPNDYLLLGKKLKNLSKLIFATFPKLDKRKCRKCGLCSKVCKENAIFFVPGNYPLFIKELCSGCKACIISCPFSAIKEEKEKVGEIYLNKIKNNFYLITGITKVGVEETGPVVREVKNFAQKFAKKIKADFILFDSPPGVHCPVISTVLGTDLVYLVTEPTPMGEHDLEQILILCKKLKLKTKIILNQSNLGEKKGIEKISKKYKVKIEKEIPYSEEIAKAYSKGRLLEINFKK